MSAYLRVFCESDDVYIVSLTIIPLLEYPDNWFSSRKETMKLIVLVAFSLSILMLLATACNSVPVESACISQDTIPEYQLCVVDTFGVEVGDSVNMIGSITSFCHHPNGSLLILDRAAGCLRILPETGDAFRVLRNGSGPGELQGAQGVCALGDGRILITDYMKQNIMTYDEHGNYLGNYFTDSGDDPPPTLWPVDSSSIMGVDADPLITDDNIEIVYSCARYDSNLQPSEVYYLLSGDAFSNEFIEAVDVLEFYADRTGHVYIIQNFTDYSIDVYAPDGSLNYTIVASVERLEKSDEQIQSEIEEYEAFAENDATYTGGYEPSKYGQLISLNGVDSDGNLWVERFDFETGYHFDIWDSNGNIAYTTCLTSIETDIEMKFLVDEIGIVGAVTDPDDYPRIYYLEKEII